MSPKPRIAILGGGAGAITAALQLSKNDWRQHFDAITIYQQGWRLGGKCASGRGVDLRIEEHGLHLWFGFYENAFRLLDRCHAELDERAQAGDPRWELPFANVEDSFSALAEIGVADHDGCGWKLWLADFFDDRDDRPWLPGDSRPPGERPDDWTVVFYLVRCLRLAADVARSLFRPEPWLDEVEEPAEDLYDALAGALGGDVHRVLDAAASLLDSLSEEAFDEPLVLRALELVVRALDFVVDFLRGRYDELVRRSDPARRAYYVVDLMLAIVRGAVHDGVIETDSFDVVDDVELRDWLLAHGAARESVDCALIRAIVYDLGFAYEDGDPQRPSCAAGTALRGLMRAFFTYRGSFMWRMNSGMGDVVFLPFYELLVKRGVDVRFFHRVERLKAANGLIERIEIDLQAQVQPGTTPEDYVTVPTAAGTEIRAWPADPPAIVAAAASAAEYESWYLGRDVARVGSTVLQRGAADGFDLVVFGLPISCVPLVAATLPAQSPRWARAVRYVRSVPTQAMQLWLNRAAPDLAGVEPGLVLSGFVEPFDTWADMCQLVDHERVSGSRTVAYFCNVLLDADPPERGQAKEWLEQQAALVREHARRFLEGDIGTLWPGAADPVSGRLHWDRLVAPPGTVGPDRLKAQYLRANVEPSERYVLSVPGSSRYRIPPDRTGFANLYAVGDWTRCGLDAGYVEGAVISGMLAANAIHRTHGEPSEAEPVIGAEGP
jgi:uncharacterized protein with NAD-binding domain and iron-sulfur cluster